MPRVRHQLAAQVAAQGRGRTLYAKKGSQRDTTSRIDTARREFLVNAGMAAGALATGPSLWALSPQSRETHGSARAFHTNTAPFQFRNEPQRKRWSFYDWTEAEVQMLSKTIGYMRNGTKEHPLSVDNPLQWDNWVLIHARHCTETKPGTVDQVHWSWFFLPAQGLSLVS
jgi:hypothetical protein